MGFTFDVQHLQGKS